MDRKWMSASRLTVEYQDGVKEFIRLAVENAKNPDMLPCPCTKCYNCKRSDARSLKDHLIIHGIDQLYTCWICHGEKEQPSNSTNAPLQEENYGTDHFEEMAQDAEENFSDHPNIFDNFLCDAREPLYPLCTKFTKLSGVLRLYNLKAAYGWSDKSFTTLVKLLKEMLPEDSVLPDCTYRAKKVLRSFNMDYEKIDVCRNDYILYRKEYAFLDKCPNPICGEPRYKRDCVPAKVMWYFPIIPRLTRLFSNVEDAKKLRWHVDEKICDGKLRHPADSEQWLSINNRYPEFGRDSRNLRLASSTDGVNPFGNQSTSHSTCPVVIVIYNLPPELCMERKYMMLTLLISGPRQPGNDIDVFLAPFVDDLNLMWDRGVDVYDAYGKETFCLRSMLFCTINDFPAYGNISGYTTKGYTACLICEEGTYYCWLDFGRKTVYLRHRSWLETNHHYRKLMKVFNGPIENNRPPRPLTDSQIYDKFKDLNVVFGKKRAQSLPKQGWKKKSIFFTLPYWEHLYVRHCLDVMHMEKNVCDSLIGTLLNVPGKTKDGINSRKDMENMGIRPELKHEIRGGKTYLPPACYTLSKAEKSAFCKFFLEVKVPSGFSSNIKSLVNINQVKLQGLKSHDCQVIMEESLPIAIREILPKHVRDNVTRLCFFFKILCSKVIDVKELTSLQKEIELILCELEMIFSPSFFDVMVHLMIHLVREVRYCGPVYLRWVYPFERYMKVLKDYVQNRYRPEGCMVERYIVEEAVEFCSNYLSGVDAIGLPKTSTIDLTEGNGLVGERTERVTSELLRQAHLYVLQNSDEVSPFIEEHMTYLRSQNLTSKSEKWIMKEHNRSFVEWFRKRILDQQQISLESMSNNLRWLSKGPLPDVKSFSAYAINGYTFHTKSHDAKSTVQNSGVTLVFETLHLPVYKQLSYYGVVANIWELNYIEFKVPFFLSTWGDVKKGVKTDDLGFILVDLSKVGHKDDPFILASQAIQVFFVPDPSNSKWVIVRVIKDRYVENNTNTEDLVAKCSVIMLVNATIVKEDDRPYLRSDHGEGLEINSSKKVSKRMRKGL